MKQSVPPKLAPKNGALSPWATAQQRIEGDCPLSILYEKFKKYQVPASSVEDFRRRYTKPDRFAQRGPEYQAAVLQAARDDLAQFGYTIISRHDSVTGEVLAYYEPNEQGVSQ